MGRNIKKGLEYYPMDVDIISDIKIRKLIKRHKGQAFTVYTLLLCNIYKNGYYICWDDDLPFVLAEQTGFTEEYILQVITYCISIGLFSSELYEQNKILTSRAIQERYSFICKQGKRKNPMQDYALISPVETSAAEVDHSVDNTPPVPISCPKETNVKDVYTALCKIVKQREDVWEAAAITNSFQNAYTEYYRSWLNLTLEDKAKYPIYQLNESLRKQCGAVNYEWYNAVYWCRENLLQSQFTEVYKLLTTKPAALSDLLKLLKEIRRGKINNPGLFILSKLKKT